MENWSELAQADVSFASTYDCLAESEAKQRTSVNNKDILQGMTTVI